jgi:tetratricopeptide (TPR) repeat protein
MSSVLRLFVIAAVFLLLSVCVWSQDLGSSNKLFGGSKTSTGEPKKASPKRVASAKPKAKSTKSKTTATAKPKLEETQPKTTSVKTANKTDTGKTSPGKKFEAFGPPTKQVEPEVPLSAAALKLYEKLIEDGNSARDDRNYSGAETAYQRAKAIKPKDPRAIYGLGNLYSDQQRWEEAESAYRAALQIDPKDPIAHIALSYVLTQPLAADNLSDRYEEAEKLARRAIQLAPSNPLAFDQLGAALELRGLIGPETENAYRKAIQFDPSFAPAYAHLGRLLRRRGLIKESTAAYQQAIDRSIDLATKILVAEVMQSEQRYAESEKLLREAIEEDPKNPAALLLLGRASTAMGNFGDAETILRRSLDVSSNGYQPNSLLAALYLRQGKFGQAENALLQAQRFAPAIEKRQLARQFETVGDGYYKTGKRSNAGRCYRQAMMLDNENTSLAVKLAKTLGG